MCGRIIKQASLILSLAAGLWLTPTAVQAFSLGGHGGFNLDRGDLHIGFDIMFPVLTVAPRVEWVLWPSFAHVVVWDGHDVELPGFDMAFFFKLRHVPIAPFVGSGFGLAIYDQVTPKFNMITGAMFTPPGRVRPFGQIAVRFIRGTFVDALFGVLFEL